MKELARVQPETKELDEYQQCKKQYGSGAEARTSIRVTSISCLVRVRFGKPFVAWLTAIHRPSLFWKLHALSKCPQ